jgi:hypothetical protein
VKLSLWSAVSGQVAFVEVYEGLVHVEVTDLTPALEAKDARALAAILTFAASEAER